ncbi:hypothetical protein AVEN_106843-1 [Araneus ventricosus]|uniref:Uncharacterized protein n=1 Tax=Araneus ventricosus TaxID=182803 RepID=A0A4Y2QG51_ARAVE|nr:hypothetical protein AVEN_106843-1 [Araneus ventricosus]
MMSRGKRSPAGEAWKFEESMPSQVSFSSSKHDSNLRGPSRNSLRVVSERRAIFEKVHYQDSFCFDVVLL